MSAFAVSGYASLDHAMAVDRPPAPDRTAVVRRRLSDPWPGRGGCAPLVALGLARAGQPVRLLTWLGDDAPGRAYLDGLADEGVEVDSVDVRPGARTACSWLLYDPEGGTTCVYDPGGNHPGRFTPAMADAVADAAWAVLTVGPEPANRAFVEALPDHCRFVFAVKADPDAFPDDLVRVCLSRADVVSFSRGERAFLEAVGREALDDVAAHGLLIETHGTDGVHLVSAGAPRQVAVDPIAAADTTGAGDTLLAHALARLAGVGGWPPSPTVAVDAVAAGVDAARDFLLRKARAREDSR